MIHYIALNLSAFHGFIRIEYSSAMPGKKNFWHMPMIIIFSSPIYSRVQQTKLKLTLFHCYNPTCTSWRTGAEVDLDIEVVTNISRDICYVSLVIYMRRSNNRYCDHLTVDSAFIGVDIALILTRVFKLNLSKKTKKLGRKTVEEKGGRFI